MRCSGAAGLGDIGTHFPDSDPKWKGANSLLFLEHARKLLDEKHFAIEHVDAVVILERPKLGPHFPKMREALAKSLGVPAEKIHLKAKTNEGVDAVGRGEAIAATCRRYPLPPCSAGRVREPCGLSHTGSSANHLR